MGGFDSNQGYSDYGNNNYGNRSYNNYDNYGYNYNDDNDYNDDSFGDNNNYQGDSDSKIMYSIKVRGMPFTATEEEIKEFFKPLYVSIVIMYRGRDRRPTGECMCYFESEEEADHALTYNKKYMGSRYIEVFAGKAEYPPGANRRPGLMDNQYGNGNSGFGGGGSGWRGGFNPADFPNLSERELAEMAKKFFASLAQFQNQSPNDNGGGGYGDYRSKSNYSQNRRNNNRY